MGGQAKLCMVLQAFGKMQKCGAEIRRCVVMM